MARKMKDSGIELLGLVPYEWSVIPLKYKVDLNKESLSGVTEPDYEFNYVEIGDVTLENGINKYVTIKFENAPSRARRIAKKDDIIVSTVRTYLKAIAIVKEEFIVSTGFAVLTPRHIDSHFLGYFLKSEYFVNIVSANSVGISYPAINASKLIEFKILLPSFTEQKSIAFFLDFKVGEVDKAIFDTKSVIEDYKKYKQSIITEAITQGLRKQKLKRTENIHIPAIPDTWEMKKMKYVFYIKKDIVGESGYDVLSITQKGIKVKDITSNAGQLAADYSNYQRVNVGDFAMNHMDLLTGWVDVSQYNGVTSPDYRVFNFISEEGFSRRYYLYLMQMCYMNRIFYGLGQGVSNLGRWRLQADKFLNFTIPVPSYEEQEEIAHYLDMKCGEIDKLISEKEELIKELENYKKSLIYEYVTGKKEVPAENV